VKASITGVAPAQLSTNGGKVTISGTGLPGSWPNANFMLSIMAGGALVQPQVLLSSPSMMVLLLPAMPAGTTFAITLVSPLQNSVGVSVASKASSTPALTLSSLALGVPGSNTLTFAKTNLLTTDPAYL
jgi:hypothetical protein